MHLFNVQRVIGSTVTYICNYGYDITGQPATQTCEPFNSTSGQWNSSMPTCSLINNYCPTFTSLGLNISFPSNTQLESVANVSCGYGLQSGQGTIQCGSFNETIGVWSALPSCTPIIDYCLPALSPNGSGSFVYSNSSR